MTVSFRYVGFISFFIPFSLVLEGSTARFNYRPNSRFGPENWENAGYGDPLVSQLTNKFANQCERGEQQSPVDLVPNSECVDDHQIRNKRGRHDWDSLQFRILPHALRVVFPSFSEFDEDKDPDTTTWPPASDFSNLSPREAVVYMDVKIPSEHTIGGTQYPGEVQIAHTFNNQVVYIAFMVDFDEDEYNIHFEQFLREWEEQSEKKRVRCHNQNNYYWNRTTYEREYPVLNSTEMEEIWGKDGNRANFDLFKLLPTVYYFGYKGSYTVPPCTETVHWRVLDLPMQISMNQYERLQSLLLDELGQDCTVNRVPYEGGVNRPIQKNRNKIWHCSGAYWKPKPPEIWCDKWPSNYHGYHKLKKIRACPE